MRRRGTQDQLLGNLARHMRERRRSLGITQEQLAEKSGLSTNFIARLEIADKTPSFATLIDLAQALGVHASELLADEAASPWISSAQEIARLMESLNPQDSQFILEQVRSLSRHIKVVRTDGHDSSEEPRKRGLIHPSRE